MTEQTFISESYMHSARFDLEDTQECAGCEDSDNAPHASDCDYYEDDNECEGHESLSGASMGASYFCDGSCV